MFTPGFSWVRVTRFVVLCVWFVDRCLSFCFFLLAIVLSVLLRITDSDYPSGIFKLLLLLFGTSDCFQNVLFIFFRHFVIHHDCENDKPFHPMKLSCVRQNRWDNQEWTIQGYWQRCTNNTHDLDLNKKRQNKAKHISES